MKFSKNDFSNKYTSIDGGGCLLWGHTLTMAAMTSFNSEKCCHMVADVVFTTLDQLPKSLCHHTWHTCQCHCL